MKTSSLGLIAVVALLLMGAIYLLEKKGGGSTAPEEAARLFRVERDEITQVTLIENDRNIQIVRQPGGKWQLEKPLVYPVDERSMAMLLTDLELARSIRTVDLAETDNPEKKKELFGLAREDALIRIKCGEETHEVVIGEATVRQGQHYALRKTRGPSEVLIVDDLLPGLLAHPLTHWRSKQLVDTDLTGLQAIVLREDGQETRLEKQAGGWAIIRPLGSPVDSLALQSYLSTVSGGQVREFINDQSGALATYGLNSPPLVLELHTGDEERTQIRIGNPKGEGEDLFYAMTSLHPSVFTITGTLRESLRDIVSATRERRLAPVRSPRDIESVRFKSREPDHPGFTVVRGGGDDGQGVGRWVFQDQPEQEVDPDVIADFLQALVDARAQAFVSAADSAGAPEAVAEGKAHAEFEITCGGVAHTIQLGARAEDTQAARTTYLPFQLEIGRPLGDRIPRDRYAWYPRTLAFLDSDPVRIEWTRPDDGLRLERDGQGNWIGGGEGREIEPSLLERQIGLLRSLKALDRFRVGESQFKNPDLALTVEGPGGARTLEFILAPGDGKVSAREAGGEVGFILDERDYLTLETFPIRREK